ncbi:MAG: DUF1801 domain-containing protein [Vicinamibacterales bacterium]
MARTPDPIDDYIAAAAPEAQPILRRIRAAVREAVPDAAETISYRMPALKVRKVFFYFAAFKKHIGIYPPVKGSAALQKRLAKYRGPKGNLQFPLDEPMPYALIAQVAKTLARDFGG